MQHMDTHELVALTDGQHRDGPALWAHDGHHLAFVSQRANSIDSEIYEIDTGVPAQQSRACWPAERVTAGGSSTAPLTITDCCLGTRAQRRRPDSIDGDPRSAELYELAVDTRRLCRPSAASLPSLPAGRSPASGEPIREHAQRHAAVQVRADTLLPRWSWSRAADGPEWAGSAAGKTIHFMHLVYFDPRGAEWRALAAPAQP